MPNVMVTSVSWNPRGQAKPLPIVNEPKIEEDEIETVEETPKPVSSSSNAMDEDDIVKRYNLDTYGEEEEAPIWGAGMKGLMYHKNNEDDPYITLPDIDNDELEDFMIRPTDDVILSAVMEEDGWSHLDVCILPESSDSNLFIHHDYLLPSFPLCVAWLPPNMAAVGTFNPEIELWDLNIVDTPEPDSKLVGHTDAVLGLAAHPIHPQMLASCSADTTIRLWDVTTQQTLSTLKHHKTKVQSLSWSPGNTNTQFEGLLASGGFDQRVCVLDVRQPDNVTTIKLDADIECLRWSSPQNGHAPLLYISTESGEVVCYDIVAGKRKWTLSAHVGAPCSSFSLYQFPQGGPTLLATSAPDSSTPLKIWTLEEGKGPACIYQKTSGFGRLYTVAFAPERPFHLALGGHMKQPQIVNLLELAEVQRAFSGVEIEMPSVHGNLRTLSGNDDDGDSDGEMDVTDGMMDEDDEPVKATPARKPSTNKYTKKTIGASKKKKY